jgi:2-polyprenyl-3-methyl-5-hydroxy-6-metoxy-1,4-benzoquinol methylase
MNAATLGRRARYLSWATRRVLRADTVCPGCGDGRSSLVRRKWLVTALYECVACGLRFRCPKDDADRAAFYDEEYAQGFTTTLPEPAELERWLADGFAGHEKDYRAYLGVLAATGVRPPATLLDFGASWGYGSWQLQRAGYHVVAVELASRRRRFAAERLGIAVIEDPARPPAPVECFFSAHVLEHLTDPNDMWRAARSALTPGGVLAAFMPNGNPALGAGGAYHRLWGQVHPLLITPRYLLTTAARYGFTARVYSSPYALDVIRARAVTHALLGPELALVAWRDAA